MYGVHRHDPNSFPYFKDTAIEKNVYIKKNAGWVCMVFTDLTQIFSHTLNTQPMEEDLYIKKNTGWVCMVFTDMTQLFPHTLNTQPMEKNVYIKKCGMGMLFADTTQLSPIL